MSMSQEHVAEFREMSADDQRAHLLSHDVATELSARVSEIGRIVLHMGAHESDAARALCGR